MRFRDLVPGIAGFLAVVVLTLLPLWLAVAQYEWAVQQTEKMISLFGSDDDDGSDITDTGADPQVRSQAQQIVILGFSAAGVLISSLIRALGNLISTLHIFRLLVRVRLYPTQVQIANKAAVPVQINVSCHPPRNVIARSILNKILKTGSVYLSWKHSRAGSFRLGAGSRGVYKCRWTDDLKSISHLRIHLENLRYIAAGGEEIAEDTFAAVVAPDGQQPQAGSWRTSLHLSVW